jgi:hypothetical protein
LAILQDELTRQLELIGSEYKPQLDQALEEWRFALPDDDELDRLASEFETRREQGETPRIELWLLLVPPAHRGKFLMRLIDIEAFQLRRQNASIDWPSFLARFPEYVAEVSRAEKQLGKSKQRNIDQTLRTRDPKRNAFPGTLSHRKRDWPWQFWKSPSCLGSHDQSLRSHQNSQ